MITFAKIKSTSIEAKKRILKVLQFGVKTADEIAPYGDDSNPLKDMTAVYIETSEAGEPVIIGYLNTEQLADIGEKRIYSQKANGEISFYIHLKNDGTIEFGGNADNLVRYTPLNSGLQAQVIKINAELVKIASGITAAGGSYVPVPISLNISGSKINEAKSI